MTTYSSICIHIAAHLYSVKDVVKFASLASDLWDALLGHTYTTNALWAVTVTESSRERGLMEWIGMYGKALRFLTLKRCSVSPTMVHPSALKNLLGLQILYCRVSPDVLHEFVKSSPKLTHLRIHQLEPGEDPGCLTQILAPLTHLRRLSLTCTKNWGIVSISLVDMPLLESLEVRAQGTLVFPCDFPPKIQHLRLHADHLYIPHGIQLPKTCSSIDLCSSRAWLDLESLFQGGPYVHLQSLSIGSAGIVFPAIVTRQIPFLETFICKSDTFLIREMPSNAKYVEIDVNACFICDTTTTRDDLQRFLHIPHVRLTERSRLCTLETLVW